MLESPAELSWASTCSRKGGSRSSCGILEPELCGGAALKEWCSASGASLQVPLSSMSLVPVGFHHHPCSPVYPAWSQRRGSGAADALGREAHGEPGAAEQCCVLLQRALGTQALCVRK